MADGLIDLATEIGTASAETGVTDLGPVDVVDADAALETLRGWYSDWETSTQDERDLAALCRRYYDGEQWTEAEKAVLKARGQPIVVSNRIAKKINYLTGSEIRTRSDPRTLPRTPQHEAAAIAMSDALRYIADEQQVPQTMTQVFEEFLVEGAGGVTVDHEQDDERIPLGASLAQSPNGVVSLAAAQARRPEVTIRVRQIHYDRMWWDPHSRECDFSDARYLGTVAWLDRADVIDTYVALGVDRAAIEEALDASRPGGDSAADTHDDRPSTWYDGSRKRYLVVECYWKEGGEVYCGHAVGGGWVYPPRKSAYVDRKGRTQCPLIFGSAFCDSANARYGIVKNMLSAQDEVNKRRSKALHAINVRQVLAEEGVTTDKRGLQQELARPDGYAEVSAGSIAEGRIQIQPGGDLSSPQLQLLQDARMEIDTIGPDAPMMAGGEGVFSGRAILARQQIGSTELEKLFDHFRRLKRNALRQVVLRVCQLWTQEKWIRVRDDVNDSGYRFIALNRPMTRAQRVQEALKRGVSPREALDSAEVPGAAELFDRGVAMLTQQFAAAGQQLPADAVEKVALQQLLDHPLAREVVTDNDISSLDVDLVLDEAPDTAIVEQEEFQSLAAMAQAGVPIPPEILIEASQLRNKRKLLNMLKAQQEQAAQAAQASQEQVQQLAIAQAQAQIEKTSADAQASMARAAKDVASAQAIAPKAAKDAAGAELAHAQAEGKALENRADAVGMQTDAYRALMAARAIDQAAGDIGGPGFSPGL